MYLMAAVESVHYVYSKHYCNRCHKIKVIMKPTFTK